MIFIDTLVVYPSTGRLLQKQLFIEIGFCCCSRGLLVINILLNAHLILMMKPLKAVRCASLHFLCVKWNVFQFQVSCVLKNRENWCFRYDKRNNVVGQLSPIQSLVGQRGRRWVMGVISQLEDGHFYLEDLTAAVEIDFSKAISFCLIACLLIYWFYFINFLSNKN